MKLNQKTRIYLKAARFEIKERLIDLLLIALPVFLVVGMVITFATFWLWLWGWFPCFR